MTSPPQPPTLVALGSSTERGCSWPLLEVRDIVKSFPGVRALNGVSFTLEAGEVRTLAGENGAGKSTLLAILGGSLRPDAGSITINGVLRTTYSPREALAEGVRIAHQEPAVVPQLTAVENLLLGRTPKGAARRARRCAARARRRGPDGLPDRRPHPGLALSPAQRHALTIARAFAFGAKIVALDEPTTSMLEHNVEEVLNQVRTIAHQRGVGVIYVSHKMPEVMSVSDTVVVLRDGKPAFDSRITETTSQEIVRKMVGRELLSFTRQHPVAADAPVIFTATDVQHPAGVGPVSLKVREGEVLGIAGLVGSGRTEFLRAVIHADADAKGTVCVDGSPVKIRSPRDSRDAGIAFIPEDRKHQGLVLQTPAFANIALTSDRQLNSFGPFTSKAKQIAKAEAVGGQMSLRPANVRLNARQFSGGNQQKIVIAKWLWRDAQVFLFDEPTKGVDVGGKVEIYDVIDNLAAQGHGDHRRLLRSSGDHLDQRPRPRHAGRQVHLRTHRRDINEHSLVASAMGQ